MWNTLSRVASNDLSPKRGSPCKYDAAVWSKATHQRTNSFSPRKSRHCLGTFDQESNGAIIEISEMYVRGIRTASGILGHLHDISAVDVDGDECDDLRPRSSAQSTRKAPRTGVEEAQCLGRRYHGEGSGEKYNMRSELLWEKCARYPQAEHHNLTSSCPPVVCAAKSLLSMRTYCSTVRTFRGIKNRPAQGR